MNRPSPAALLSITYFGPIQYYSKFIVFPKIFIERYENYTKQTYRNRCIIYGANGPLVLTVPVLKGTSRKTFTRDVKIDYDKDWQKLHWKGIESAYRSSPFFEFYMDEMEPFFKRRYAFLFDLNLEIQDTILALLDISADITLTDSYLVDSDKDTKDYRELLNPKRSYKKDPEFIPESYNQVFSTKHGFLPNLSILDLLFNEGPDAIEIIRKSGRKC